MKKIAERMRGCIETLSLSALLVINLSFMVLLMLGYARRRLGPAKSR